MEFPYVSPSGPQSVMMPYFTLQLRHGAEVIAIKALVDGGATLNVLPFDAGVGLGLAWENAPVLPPVGGVLRGIATRGVKLHGTVAPYSEVALAFAWASTSAMPVLLGQVNFFAEFEVRFQRWRSTFEIVPRPAATP